MLKYKIKIRPASEEDIPRECLLEEINLNNFEIRLKSAGLLGIEKVSQLN